MNKEPRDWSKVQRKKAPHHINLRLTTEEHDRLKTIAERLCTSKAGYAKSAIFDRPIPRAAKRPTKQSADLSQILGQLGKLGSNANQIAKLCNSGKFHDHSAAVDALQGIKAELSAMRAALLKALDEQP